ncbi:MAG TPA: multicopper oxidase domain-containing protein [Pyrinomonadaceae bacterium]|nr:multicopper oxidase domain-containing protein [Pyrinomonadaceae bacterium]
MAKKSKRDKTREKDARIAARNRRELIAAGLKRRDLMKMGLLTAAGMLIPKKGLSAHPLTSAGFVDDDEPNSPPTTPFAQEMPRLFVMPQSAALTPAPTIAPNTAAGEARTVAHQAFAQFPPQRFYEMSQQEGFVNVTPPALDELPPQPIWGFAPVVNGVVGNAMTPGPLIVERYGNLGNPQAGSVLVRQRNNLPLNNRGFGLPSITTHLHNGHTPPESDGFPCFFFERGQFYDYHYPNVYAGVNSTHPGAGDIKEAMHTLWYHDHRVDHTAENTYKGLAGAYILFNEKDTGDETTGFRLPSFGDGQNPLTSFDVYMVFNDKVFDDQTGLLAFDLFNFDGILGDKFLVNGKIQPVFHVSPRRYRFRWLNTGPSRFYQFFLTNAANNSTLPFWQISTDGNLMERPVQVNSSRVSVAERVDVVVDFTGLAGKTFYIENRLEQDDGRGPDGDVVGAGQGDKLLKIVVDGPVVPDNSLHPSQQVFYGFPNTTEPARITRTFRFERGNGQWQVNGKLVDCDETRFAIKRNTIEKWRFQNNSGGWQHPIHMHFEEFQTLQINGRAPRNSGIIERGRKDVFRLEHNMETTVYFRFRDFVGRLPLHCHNVVHEDHAMMALLEINDVGDNKTNP